MMGPCNAIARRSVAHRMRTNEVDVGWFTAPELAGYQLARGTYEFPAALDRARATVSREMGSAAC